MASSPIVIGAAHLQLQRRFGTGKALDVSHAAGIVARLVIGLGDDQLVLGIQCTDLSQYLAVGDHVLVLAGIVIVGELGLGARRRSRRRPRPPRYTA